MILRTALSKGMVENDVQALKNEMLLDIYKMLTIHLGTPPKSFDWQVRNRKKVFAF